jgi:hypothetical protein
VEADQEEIMPKVTKRKAKKKKELGIRTKSGQLIVAPSWFPKAWKEYMKK